VHDVAALVARIRLALREGEHCVAICGLSIDDGAGDLAASVVSACLQMEESASLLVDADVTMPIAHKRFGVSESPGLLDCLANTDPIERCTHGCSLPRLRVMPPGHSASPAVQLLASEHCREGFGVLRSQFGCIIVSIAGAATTAEGLPVTDQCDAYVVAVTAGHSRDELASLERQMSRTRARALGAVLMQDDREGKAHGWRR
jgi:MinD-like ATPase involved in chromosome partitioning or flagellar assembly